MRTMIVLIIDDVTTISIELTETSAAVCMQSALVFLVPQRCCAWFTFIASNIDDLKLDTLCDNWNLDIH